MKCKTFLNKFLCGDSTDVLTHFKPNCIDLVITENPCINNHKIHNKSLSNFEKFANQLHRIVKKNGVVVWITPPVILLLQDSTDISNIEIYKQLEIFNNIGLKLYDSLIYAKLNYSKNKSGRYPSAWEHIFILCKGKQPVIEKLLYNTNTKKNNFSSHTKIEFDDTDTKRVTKQIHKENKSLIVKPYCRTRKKLKTKDTIMSNLFFHPAQYFIDNISSKNNMYALPESLVRDLILIYSYKKDIVLDPFCGSGTVNRVAVACSRNHIGIDIDPKCLKYAKEHINHADKVTLSKIPIHIPEKYELVYEREGMIEDGVIYESFI